MKPSRKWAIALWLAAYAACGPIPNPPTPKPPIVVAVTVVASTDGRPIGGATVWHQPKPDVTRQTDLTGAASLPVASITSGVCTKRDGFHSPGLPDQPYTCIPLTGSSVRLALEPVPPPAPKPLPTPVLRTERQIFRDAAAGNVGWRWKGVSAFKLARRFQLGEDIGPFLAAYKGYNILRVWPYVTWTGTGWEPPTVDVLKAFLRRVGDAGWMVELTLLTDDNASRIPWAKALVASLAAAPRPTNLVIEIGNEPETHKHIDTQALKAVLDASGFLYASGNYESCGDEQHPCSKAFGLFGDAHTPRDSEWPRKAHDLMEYFHGKGPHYITEPARPYPWVADEPAKTQDVAPPKAPLTKADDWRAYGGTAALLGAGATFHCETCKYADLPTAEERTLAAAMLEGLNAFPAEAPTGQYARPSDASLRTYTIDGKWMVRVRPTTSAPSGGWTRIGTSNILWKR